MSVFAQNNYDGKKFNLPPFEGGKGEAYATFDNDLRAYLVGLPVSHDDDYDHEMALLGTDPGSLNNTIAAAGGNPPIRDPAGLTAAAQRHWKQKQHAVYSILHKHVMLEGIRMRFKNECIIVVAVWFLTTKNKVADVKRGKPGAQRPMKKSGAMGASRPSGKVAPHTEGGTTPVMSDRISTPVSAGSDVKAGGAYTSSTCEA